MLTERTVLGWSLPQWRIAFAEFAPGLSAARVFCAAAAGRVEELDVMSDVARAWQERHAYDPGKSPIVLVRGCLQQEVAPC